MLVVPGEKKRGWKDQSVVKMLQENYPSKKIQIQTDVNASAYCEYITRGDSLKSSIAYITVGTGIGVGLVINSKPVTGLMHPEGGHISLAIDYSKVNPEHNSCNHHLNCVEGYSTNMYAANYLDCDINELEEHSKDEVFEKIARNIGQLCSSVCMLTSVEKIVIGGGVSQSHNFLTNVRASFHDHIAGYIPLKEKLEDYIVLCEDFDTIGIRGAAYMSLEN